MNQPATAPRFNFGDNWQSYAKTLSEAQIAEAESGLQRLLGQKRIEGARFLDIGCGSGVHALAAVRMGAHVTAMDLDPQSVAATRGTLEAHAHGRPWTVEKRNILDPHPARPELYDIVYSWGVLHHTGSMWAAMDNAAAHVAPGGRLVIALYKETPACGFWQKEKAFYSRLPRLLRIPFTTVYAALMLAGITVKGRNPVKYVRTYKTQRGMDFWHDCIDWLGGSPYESASPAAVAAWAKKHGFTPGTSFNTQPSVAGGLLGTGCAEYVFTRPLL